MNRARKIEVPHHLVLTSMLSIGITVTVSISYTVLSVLCLILRYQCNAGSPETINGADYFMTLLYKGYIQSDNCENALVWEDLTRADSVFILNILTLCASVLSCVAATILISTLMTEDNTSYLHVAAYVYVGICAASLVVDLTFAIHFGMDYGFLTNDLSVSSPGLGMNYERDAMRLGALLLMTVTLKGFALPALNCVLLALIIFYVTQLRQTVQKEQHSIHKQGALNAYDQPRRQTSSQPDYHQPEMFYRGSESWQNAMLGSDRPFSYLEGPKMASAGLSRASSSVYTRETPGPAPAPVPAWRRDPQPPVPVPAPDYSPHTPRRLKPALKHYM